MLLPQDEEQALAEAADRIEAADRTEAAPAHSPLQRAQVSLFSCKIWQRSAITAIRRAPLQFCPAQPGSLAPQDGQSSAEAANRAEVADARALLLHAQVSLLSYAICNNRQSHAMSCLPLPCCNFAAAHQRLLVPPQDHQSLTQAADRTATADAQAPLLHAQVSL